MQDDVIPHAEAGDEQIAPVPRISLQAFCETAELASVIADAAEDRRMDKAHVRVQMGGAPGAVEAYRSAPTPNVVILETTGRKGEILGHLDELAEVCDATTKVIVVGQVNDILLYRELMARGVSEYLIGPVGVLAVIRAVSSLYAAEGAKPVGRSIAIIGAKGGVGASTIAHNLAWAISRDIGTDTCIADMDLAFGTGGLDFNQDPPQGIADAIFSPDRVDTAFVDRLLSRCADNLSLLAAPATLDRVSDLGPRPSTRSSTSSRRHAVHRARPAAHLDRLDEARLVTADEILVVATPDLANLRNAKNLMDLLRASRPNDTPPRYILNQIGVAKRPEIKPADFAKALEAEPIAVIPFEPQLFGTAANNGQMIAEMEPGHRIALQFTDLALAVTAVTTPARPRPACWGRSRRSWRSSASSARRPDGKPRTIEAACSANAAIQVPASGAPPLLGRRRSTVRRRPAAAPVARAPEPARVPSVSSPPIAPLAPAEDRQRSSSFYETKSQVFGALIEAIDLSQLAKLDAQSAREEIRDIVNEIITIKNIVMSIAEQEDLLEDICNDVLGYGPLEPLLAATTSPTSW